MIAATVKTEVAGHHNTTEVYNSFKRTITYSSLCAVIKRYSPFTVFTVY